MNLYYLIFIIPCATCLTCWYQLGKTPISTIECEVCYVSSMKLSKDGTTSSFSAKTCPSNSSECDTLCRVAINGWAVIDKSVKVSSCKAKCCNTDRCNKDDLLKDVPFYNDASQCTGIAFLNWKIFFGIVIVSFAQKFLL
ncbi:uncharacterized protein LOC124810019 [Hydra vulgaris]|uniref:uncharacterized protein LOC124810019 n=1 Tax=Hydra vulgaris TaxID=6087 RepID=UPI001F5FD734|nr:uncharacterized protein LOC124810019 [Hydra vulgaris]